MTTPWDKAMHAVIKFNHTFDTFSLTWSVLIPCENPKRGRRTANRAGAKTTWSRNTFFNASRVTLVGPTSLSRLMYHVLSTGPFRNHTKLSLDTHHVLKRTVNRNPMAVMVAVLCTLYALSCLFSTRVWAIMSPSPHTKPTRHTHD